MSKAPARCLYCDGTDLDCGFCTLGVPLDTQADWDATWGRTLEHAVRLPDEEIGFYTVDGLPATPGGKWGRRLPDEEIGYEGER